MPSDSERKSVKATVTPRKDNTGPKPLLTRKHVDAFVNKHCDCTDPRCKFEEAACRTIDRMAELLERAVNDDIGVNSMTLHDDIEAFLQTFNATGGEGSCLPESK